MAHVTISTNMYRKLSPDVLTGYYMGYTFYQREIHIISRTSQRSERVSDMICVTS